MADTDEGRPAAAQAAAQQAGKRYGRADTQAVVQLARACKDDSDDLGLTSRAVMARWILDHATLSSSPVADPTFCPECGHAWHDSYCPVETSPSEIAAFPHTCGCIAHEDRKPAAPVADSPTWQPITAGEIRTGLLDTFEIQSSDVFYRKMPLPSVSSDAGKK